MSYVYYVMNGGTSHQTYEKIVKWCTGTGGEDDCVSVTFYDRHSEFIKFLARLSREHPSELISIDMAYEEPEVFQQRIYARNGKTQVVDRIFPPCSLPEAKLMRIDYTITLPNRQAVSVTVTAPENVTKEELEALARAELLKMLKDG